MSEEKKTVSGTFICQKCILKCFQLGCYIQCLSMTQSNFLLCVVYISVHYKYPYEMVYWFFFFFLDFVSKVSDGWSVMVYPFISPNRLAILSFFTFLFASFTLVAHHIFVWSVMRLWFESISNVKKKNINENPSRKKLWIIWLEFWISQEL